ncbi:MAG: hypothetical protein ACI9FB_000089 [Candidatus Azotimanducaceae bacterium]|jgi:hypothetical protein
MKGNKNDNGDDKVSKGKKISALHDILQRVQCPNAITMDCSPFQRGIDNYHVDVHLSDSFVLQAYSIIESVVKRVVAGQKAIPRNTDELDYFRNAYSDMMETSYHRVKTNLTVETIRFLHFGVIKYVLLEVGSQLDKMLGQLEASIAQQQYAGSRNLLPTQEKLAWFRKNYNEFLYRSNRALFQVLQREESGHLRELRQQLLGTDFPEVVNILFNPMLTAKSPDEPLLIIENYGFWPEAGKGFSDANQSLESLLQKSLSELDTPSLKPEDRPKSAQSEIYDELSGLFAVQSLLGPSDDQSDHLIEEFCWLDQPGNIRLLFDTSIHESNSQKVKDAQGMKAQWKFNSELKPLIKLVAELRKSLFTGSQLKEALAAYLLREVWLMADNEVMAPAIACAYIAGTETKKILSKLDLEKESTISLLKRLDELSDELNRQFKEELEEKFLRLLSDLCRYRLHLKYFRLAHRIVNRINLISEPGEIQLARAGGKLYELLNHKELLVLEVKEPEIIHHVIVKADIRGSTKVIAELMKKGLNPASYFSQRFFDPLNELLGKYGAVKVFIEGDAVILCIYELSDEPHQWYAVARGCGIAKDIIDIVHSKNSHSKQTDLPNLEVGIGITFCPEKPLFLFDNDKPIMISPAIGEADRLSSCSWKLRNSFSGGRFNVEVLEIADGELSKGEKGQNELRYNVNGILIDNASFSKLKSEVVIKRLKIKVDDKPETMFVCKFPDIAGKERELVIREGSVGLWKDDEVKVLSKNALTKDQFFYEVLTNSKLNSQVLEVARKTK